MLDPFGRGRSARFFDANGDGRPDLFLSNDPTRGDGMPSPNRFFTNQLEAPCYAPEYGLELETSFKEVSTPAWATSTRTAGRICF